MTKWWRSATTTPRSEWRYPANLACQAIALRLIEHRRESNAHRVECGAQVIVGVVHDRSVLLSGVLEQWPNRIALRVTVRLDHVLHVRNESRRPSQGAELRTTPAHECRVGEQAECESDHQRCREQHE